jgi:hypothetical protein
MTVVHSASSRDNRLVRKKPHRSLAKARQPNAQPFQNLRLTLWVPLNAAAPCWPCDRLGHVKVDGESGVRFHGFCQTQIRKQPSHSPHACQACRRHLVVCIPSLKGVRPSWSHASPPIRRPLWRWHCCSLLQCRLVPQRAVPRRLSPRSSPSSLSSAWPRGPLDMSPCARALAGTAVS